MHPLKCYHLAASEMDLHKLFHGKPSERAKKGDQVLLIRTIQLTADLTVTCPVTFLMLPDIQFITKPFALRTAWEDDRSSAVLCFRSCSKAESVLSSVFSRMILLAADISLPATSRCRIYSYTVICSPKKQRTARRTVNSTGLRAVSFSPQETLYAIHNP